MKKIRFLPLIFLTIGFTIIGCRKSKVTEPPVETTPAVTKVIIDELATNVIAATYTDMAAQATVLYSSVQTFNTTPTDANLTACKQAWRTTRQAWEQSEGFLFGPVATNNIDPRIDTWPVNYQSLDSVLNSSAIFSTAYVDGLEDGLRGFHPIEYLLFGIGGNKTASQFTVRQKEFLLALCENLKGLTNIAANEWNTSTTNNFISQFTTAGSGSNVYSTQRAAYEEMVNAMIGICDEVANGKMYEPFTQQNQALEESPFAFNSLIDFTNNIKSVQNIYLGKYNTDGKGIEDLVKANKLSLDGDVKTKLNNAISSLNNITIPFGQAITQQPVQVQNAIDAINDLKSAIENNLLPFVQQYTK